MKNSLSRFNNHKEKLFFHGALSVLFLTAAILITLFGLGQAQELKTIKLGAPDKDAGFSIMKSLSLRQSTKDTTKWSEKDLSLQDLSNLLWAGNGINREDGKRTAASAMNSQDVDIFVLRKDGIYVYDAANNAMNPVVSGDHRSEIGMVGGGPRPAGATGGAPGSAPAAGQGAPAGVPGAAPAAGGTAGARQSFNYPIKILLVSETSRFRAGTAELKAQWGIFDAGLVAQNMMLLCSGTGLVAHPKSAVDTEGKIKSLLKLTDTQIVAIELDIGYPKE